MLWNLVLTQLDGLGHGLSDLATALRTEAVSLAEFQDMLISGTMVYVALLRRDS